jgi:hypothetical protein
VVRGVAQVLATEFAAVKPDNVVAATTGGLVAANAVIEELVRLHAVGTASVQVLEIPDGAFATRDDQAVAEKFHPAAGFRARWQALSLIEGGSLLAAWGAVRHLANEPGQEWTRIIDWLRCFASSLPMPDDCDVSVLKHPRMAVRAALRVELALRAGDIPRAVHGTVAFFEAALWDHLGEKTSRHPSKYHFKFHVPPADELVRERDVTKLAALSKTKQREDRDRPFIFKETVDGSDWYRIDDTEICAIQIAKHYLNRDSLTKLGQALDSDIRELRNDVAHNQPTPALMDDARRRMQEALLWSAESKFLSQPLIQDVLCELGEPQPDALCTDLLRTIRDRLLALPRP